MLTIYSDPDYTGFPLAAGSPPSFWRLTRDQWYVITRILFREHVRQHAFRDPGKSDPDEVELASIRYKVREMVRGMINDPAWANIPWAMRVPWSVIGCYGSWVASGWDQMVAFPEYMCPQDVQHDLSYQSGLAAYGAPLDALQPFTDFLNAPRYELACDQAFNEAMSGLSFVGKDQQPTVDPGAVSNTDSSDTSESKAVRAVTFGVVGGLLFYGLSWGMGWKTGSRAAAAVAGVVAGAVMGATQS